MSKGVGSSNKLTFDEWHAAAMGIVIGLVVIYLQQTGSQQLARGIVGLFVLVALGQKAREKASKGRTTIRKEPWYALGGLAVGGGAALAATAVLM